MIYYNNTNIDKIHSTSSVTTLDVELRGCESDTLMLVMKIQPIFLLIFGFLANLCSFAVLIQPRLRCRPTFSYLAFLSLSNAFLSLIHAFFTIIGVYFGVTLENLSLFIFCRLLNRFLIDFLTHFSLLTLTAVDLDRCRTATSKTVVYRNANRGSSHRENGCSKGFIRVCLIELCFALALFFVDLHWLTSYGYTKPNLNLNEPNKITMCTIVNKNGSISFYGKYLTSILPVIELILFGILPFSISFITTIIILRHLSIKYTSMNSHNRYSVQCRRCLELHLSISLISVNFVYILFTTPHNIFSVYLGNLHNQLYHKNESEDVLCSLAITQKSLDLLQQCYFMSTFFLYILTNKRFREELYRLIQCCVFILFPKKNTNNLELTLSTSPNRIIISTDNNQRNISGNYLTARCQDVSRNWGSISSVYEKNELVSILNKD
ncbi:unnamed protein product [Rotaria socialis]|uniref:G-protein coupled receptors family 1 profile domain-containing protein n=1 Tax=Rotaria socialis TaxID=392032 RepID=A0A818BXZ3_9BILA|nr:unnamed protein product [Rotaria socialis]CAF3338940.1 unnamed protein product [Rotaria socialis]CAF3423891.1 unnamed protein product [Rotaria socialis]CAF3654105.1 unnamed protein product [Rotaria socialis]CAF4352401.1 unnamed protein product [Rotaria socialis]